MSNTVVNTRDTGTEASPQVEAALPLDDIQGVILRGYNFASVRHFVLRIIAPMAGRHLVGRLTAGPEPQISSSADWSQVRPEYRLQIGFTYAGLKALELPPTSLEGFRKHRAFFEGAVARSAGLGDSGESTPENWTGRLNETEKVHLLISLYATDAALETYTSQLRGLWAGVLEELSMFTGHKLPDDSVHFGFQDGISQPTIAGAPPPTSPSTPLAPPSAFLLGYASPWPSFNLAVPLPEALGRNGSFAAFRIIQQHVGKFEEFLTQSATATGRDREWIAAKLCGRWRSGVPMVLSPDVQSSEPPIPDAQLDDFDYVEDPAGERCPLGAHTRRAFPRSDSIAGGPGVAFRHRIIRRGMPYGPWFDPNHPTDEERGLLGLFICASIESQFEFILAEWLNHGSFSGQLPAASRDPFVSATPPGGPVQPPMKIPVSGAAALQLSGFEQFVTTKGGAYIFFPSLTALRYIAGL